MCTKKCNETRALFDAHASVEKIYESVAALRSAMNELTKAHVSVQALMSEEDKEKDRTEWYEPKVAVYESFLHEVDLWKKSKSDPQSEINPGRQCIKDWVKSLVGVILARTSSCREGRRLRPKRMG